ncbi:double-strand break repair helicase AddA [Pelagibacterium sp. 26DY04]|uniref:double-strand break repair helicase AddA n=1 Tax=Pelagibacterium sp. 26DY04 TaxID=2967130 RepID=UPI0028161507|nr:double-strand break repair helicase AddA [Pelagibacterium sp. 26DY04]WMT87264.1 double-strand break repair helicase AddA [Pelagibacterium sp. 26DY04]
MTAEIKEQLSVPHDTTLKQARVAEPHANAWVSANAGSGKTYVLSRRVLRLLLDGAQPEAILCLTYTKAAAAEMRHRATAILARWARQDDTDLETELGELVGRRPSGTERRRARALFAHALDTPGGLKINTIHAFCEAVLQRFPREAGVPVNFTVIEEEAATRLLREARETVLAEGLIASGPEGDAVRALFDALSDMQIETAIGQCLSNARKLGPILANPERAIAAMRTRLNLSLGANSDSLRNQVLAQSLVPPSDWPEIFRICPPDGTKSRFEDKLSQIDLDNPDLDTLFAAYLTDKGKVRANFPKASIKRQNPGLAERLAREADRLEVLYDHRKAIAIADNSAALTRVLAAIIARYEAQKRARSLMDFDDLVARTAALLGDRGLGAWVRYKLDAGIDHILVDESQDTNPEQWAVIGALVDDYFSGDGAAQRPKTIFAVGDPKQSIYSFQGAEPRLFVEKGRELQHLAQAADRDWHGETLRTSFRTLSGILYGVDRVFNRSDIATALLAKTGEIGHEAARKRGGGHIEIWPVIESPDAPAIPEEWPTEPLESLAAAPRQLATRIVDTIANWIETRVPVGPGARPIRPEDILILVQKRNGIFPEIVRALKQRNIASPGADRLPVSAHIAIDDLLGLADALLTPADDLTLAAVLRSPLFGVGEDELFTLAHGRKGQTLFDRLAESPLPIARAAHERLVGLRQRLDFDRPYEFFAHVLYAQGGLKQFHARLGEEVDEVIAEFLDLALEHETSEQPSLTGFIAAMRASDIVIKRDLVAKAAGVRVMTVHGAKGLEAPVVILADAASKPRAASDSVYFGEQDDVPFLLYCANKDNHCQASLPLRDEVEARGLAEYWRNLYVAMTRAEEGLHIAGTRDMRTRIEETWHGAITAALAEESETVTDARGEVLRYPAGVPTSAPSVESTVEERTSTRPLILSPPRRRPVMPVLSPSRSEHEWMPRGLETAAEALLDARAARQRGIALHALLQHLSNVPQNRRSAVAHSAAQTLLPDDADLVAPVVERALAILSDPHLAAIFGSESRAEVPFSLTVRHKGAPARLEGRIDRLVHTPAHVLVVDYKSDAVVPSGPETMPPGYMRQLGLYRFATQTLFPHAVVDAAILWTQISTLMRIPADLLDIAASDVTRL